MAKYLPEFGVEPIILTVDESYASYPLVDESFLKEIPKELKVIKTNSFEPLHYYSKLVGKKSVPYSGFANVETESWVSKFSRWVRGNFFIPDARKGWNKYALNAARKLLNEKSIETIITTGPPHSTHLIGLQLKKEFAVKWVADFRDPWTDIYYYEKLMHGSRAGRLDRNYEMDVLSRSDLVLSVCPSNRILLKSKLPKDLHSRIKLVPNGFDETDFENRKATSNEVFTMAYTGTMAANYNFSPLFDALSSLDIGWKLIVAGSISPEVLQQFEVHHFYDHVEFLGYVDHDKVLDILISADLLLHVLPKGEKGTTGKLFEYIGSGKPILNLGAKVGDAAFYINEAKAGRTFSDDEKEEMINYILGIASKSIHFDSQRLAHSRKARARLLAEILSTDDKGMED